ncbi:MAG TPA: PhnD/SsuA/transferrin family substrate-binding protein [Actinomycetota bacterium]|nr:PhnD/SsuA/transferrin family substrate-binding protein [Actinomycetota bacterium]
MSEAALLVGAVAYHERVVPIWEVFREYFTEQDVPVDYVLFSNYERQVDALLSGRIDIGWNTNTAYVRARHAAGRPVQILGMRDVDSDWATLLVTRKGEGFEKPAELAGKRLALGSRDSGHAAILPLYYLDREGLDAAAECDLIRFDTDLGKHGDTGDSELRVLRAVADGRADAGAVGAPLWASLKSKADPLTNGLEVQWRSEDYYHCNFTALDSLDPDLSRRWSRALLAMDYNDPQLRHAMDLEGVKKWLPGGEDGYSTLTEAMAQQGYLD